MTEFEYAAIFYGILVALAIEAVAANLHRLLAAGRRVKWHWMAPATAVNASLVTLLEFWTLWLRRNESSGSYTFLLFLPFAISLVFMYLSAAATLPDEVPAGGLSLRTYYFDNRGHYWGLVVGLFVFNVLLNVIDQFRFGWFGPAWQRDLPQLAGDLVAIGVAAPLIFVRNYWWHAIGICTGTVYLLTYAGSMSL
jgi:hypothetical protein